MVTFKNRYSTVRHMQRMDGVLEHLRALIIYAAEKNNPKKSERQGKSG